MTPLRYDRIPISYRVVPFKLHRADDRHFVQDTTLAGRTVDNRQHADGAGGVHYLDNNIDLKTCQEVLNS